MLRQAVLDYFGRRADVARALGDTRTASAVYQWGAVVPLAAARRLEKLTRGKLRVNPELYDEFGHAIKPKQF